jgi:hypothetical protein
VSQRAHRSRAWGSHGGRWRCWCRHASLPRRWSSSAERRDPDRGGGGPRAGWWVAQQVATNAGGLQATQLAEGGRRHLRGGRRVPALVVRGGGRVRLACGAALSSPAGCAASLMVAAHTSPRKFARFRVEKETGTDQIDPQSNGQHRKFAGSDG